MLWFSRKRSQAAQPSAASAIDATRQWQVGGSGKTCGLEALESGGGRGTFSPQSFLLTIGYPMDEWGGGSTAHGARTLWHEYVHFLQSTTTTYGLTVLLLEYFTAVQTFSHFKKLRRTNAEIRLPLRHVTEQPGGAAHDASLAELARRRRRADEYLALLRGSCTIGSGDVIRLEGRAVANQDACPIIDLPPAVTHPRKLLMGARALMEAGASVSEWALLGYFGLCGLDHCRVAAAEWDLPISAGPNYYAATVLTAETLGDILAVLPLVDLALFPRVYWPQDDDEILPRTQFPGARFAMLLAAAKGLTAPTLERFHDEYEPYIRRVCARLGWPVPWEQSARLLKDIQAMLLDTQDAEFCDMIGPALTLLTGFTLRSKYPSRCVLPVPDLRKVVQNTPTSRTMISLAETVALHPPPFVIGADSGTELFIELATRAYAGQILKSRKALHREVSQSYEQYMLALAILTLAWNGLGARARGDGDGCDVRCLRPHGPVGCCPGSFICGARVKPSDSCESCVCVREFERVIGRHPSAVSWTS